MPKIHLHRRHVSRHSRPYFSELECSLSSDMAWMSHFCRQWRLKPSASKTISSVFHLHNTSATRELSVYLDGQHLWQDCHQTYLEVTLDRMLSYRQHLTKTTGKLKNRNNLLMKLAGCNIHIAPERSKTQRHSEDRAKPSKIKALYSWFTCKNCSYLCAPL